MLADVIAENVQQNIFIRTQFVSKLFEYGQIFEKFYDIFVGRIEHRPNVKMSFFRATLLEGVNNKKINKIHQVNSFILLWCKKCEKLENEVILVQRSVSTINLWRKNEENRPILSDNDKKKSDCVFKCQQTIAENCRKYRYKVVLIS